MKNDKNSRIKRPLINPSVEDFVNVELPSGQSQEEGLDQQMMGNSKEQLRLDTDTPATKMAQRFSALKMYLRKKNQIFEIAAIWRTPALPFTIVSIFSIVFFLIFVIVFEFEKIPPKIPFIYNSIEKHWEQADKSILFVLLILILTIESIIVYLNIKVFDKDKRLGFTLNWMLTLINLLLLVFLIQTHYLIT